MYPTDPSDRLFKITRYALYRGGKRLEIEIFHALTGPDAGQHRAVIQCDGVETSPDFWGEGPTETAALRDSLVKLKGLPKKKILNHEHLRASTLKLVRS